MLSFAVSLTASDRSEGPLGPERLVGLLRRLALRGRLDEEDDDDDDVGLAVDELLEGREELERA